MRKRSDKCNPFQDVLAKQLCDLGGGTSAEWSHRNGRIRLYLWFI